MTRRGARGAVLRAVTLDVTGTLLHVPRLGALYAEVLARHGIRVDASEVQRLAPLVWQELDCLHRLGEERFSAHPAGARGWWARYSARLCEHLGAPAPGPFALAELFQRFSGGEAYEVYPEVGPSLEALRAGGLRLAVVSNWDDRLPAVLEATGLLRQVEVVVWSSAAGIEKPHPAIFLAALAELGVSPRHAVHVGDSRRHDLEGAQAAGMEALLLDRRHGRGDLSSLLGLPTAVAQLAARRSRPEGRGPGSGSRPL